MPRERDSLVEEGNRRETNLVVVKMSRTTFHIVRLDSLRPLSKSKISTYSADSPQEAVREHVVGMDLDGNIKLGVYTNKKEALKGGTPNWRFTKSELVKIAKTNLPTGR